MKFDKVVVTGGAGKLGRSVVDRLAKHCQVTVLDIAASPTGLAKGVEYICASITDHAAMRRAFQGQDAVIHLAAIPNPRTAPAPVTFHTNVQGAWVVMQAAEDAGVRRVTVASSDSVFGLSYNPPDWPPKYLPVDEAHPCRPTEFYSLSKRVTETIAESFAARRKLEVLGIRPVHIVFPPEYPELQARGSDPQNYHFWAYVAPQDVAQGFHKTLEIDYRGYDLFTISAGDGLNTKPTLEIAAERWGKVPEVRRPHYYKANPLASVIDITKAREVLGYEPTITWRDMLAGQATWETGDTR
ncbi:MAG TPA: NAD(P)-dependent oxidoreductase [Hyphomicrobiaceae bacterium]|nr:NAD(P)-dependent oxidoreductase [Hyphomicrobiaceae bacterium]